MGRVGKTKERKLAREYYIKQGKSAKETAALVEVNANTLTNWIKKYGWKAEREAYALSSNAQIQNIKDLISQTAEDRITLMQRIKELQEEGNYEEADKIRRQIATIDDGIAKWNKTLMTIDKENQISLSVYIHVMEAIFKGLNMDFPKFYKDKLIDWQMKHIESVSQRYL